jgi:LacI family transcriptional regulator
MTTIYDVAQVAGVSIATVSRVLRGSDRVHPDTRQRVLAVIETLGFVPDASARGLTRRRKDIIGLVGLERGTNEIDIEQSSLLFVDHIVHAAETVLRGTEYSLLLTFGSRGELFEKRVRSLAGQVDGLIIAEEVLDQGELSALAAQIPVVVIAGRRDQAAVDVFLGDNAGGMTAVTRHLTEEHQYHRLCFVAGPRDAPDATERRLAFEQAVAASPGSGIDQVIQGDFSEDSGVAAARTIVSRKSLPQAVVCANDQMAIGALRELQQAGVRIPADVAVTGFDDVHASRVIDPPLTTVSQPFRELGSRAARRLLARIDEPSLPPAVEVLPTQAVIRASCGCPPRQQRLGRLMTCLKSATHAWSSHPCSKDAHGCEQACRSLFKHVTAASSRKEILHAKPPHHTEVAGDLSTGGTEWEKKGSRGSGAHHAGPGGRARRGHRLGAVGVRCHGPGTAVRLDDGVQRQFLRGGRLRRGLELDL